MHHLFSPSRILLALLLSPLVLSIPADSPDQTENLETIQLFERIPASLNSDAGPGDGKCTPGERMCMGVNKHWTMHICDVKGSWNYMADCGRGDKCCRQGSNGYLYCVC